MKRLWQVVDREMRKDGLTAKEMSARLRMDPAHLSRLRTGHLRDLSADSLAHLVAGFDKSLHEEILAAYLADKLEGSKVGAPRSAARNSLSLAEEAPSYGGDAASEIAAACVRVGANRRVAAAIASLAALAPSNRRLQMLLISLAEYAREK